MTALTLEELDELERAAAIDGGKTWPEWQRLIDFARAHLTSQAWREIERGVVFQRLAQWFEMNGDSVGDAGDKANALLGYIRPWPAAICERIPPTNTNGERDGGTAGLGADSLDRMGAVGSPIREVAAPAITEEEKVGISPFEYAVRASIRAPLPEPIAAGEELRILRSGLERIGKIANTDPWRTFDGMIQDMQLIDDICRGLNSDPIIPPPIAAGEDNAALERVANAIHRAYHNEECLVMGTGFVDRDREPWARMAAKAVIAATGEKKWREQFWEVQAKINHLIELCREQPALNSCLTVYQIYEAIGLVTDTPIAAGGGEETRGQKLAKQIEEMAPHVGMKFTPDPEKIAQFDKPSPSSSDLVERLRKRKEFFTNDGAHWLMSPMPDQDCAEAADTIADQEIWIEQLKAVIQRLEAELRSAEGRNKEMEAKLTEFYLSMLAKVKK
jgi:hypothetical protein